MYLAVHSVKTLCTVFSINSTINWLQFTTLLSNRIINVFIIDDNLFDRFGSKKTCGEKTKTIHRKSNRSYEWSGQNGSIVRNVCKICAVRQLVSITVLKMDYKLDTIATVKKNSKIKEIYKHWKTHRTLQVSAFHWYNHWWRGNSSKDCLCPE